MGMDRDLGLILLESRLAQLKPVVSGKQLREGIEDGR